MSERTEPISNKRRDTRFALKPPLALGIHGDSLPAIRAQLVNVSRSGTAILADVLLGDPGVVFVLNLPDHTAIERTPVPCELRWALAEKDALSPRWLHGALFGHIDARARWLLEQLIHDARRTPHGSESVIGRELDQRRRVLFTLYPIGYILTGRRVGCFIALWEGSHGRRPASGGAVRAGRGRRARGLCAPLRDP